MRHFLIGNFASFLPERHRTRIHVNPRSAMSCGILQFLICLGIFIYRFFSFVGSDVFGGPHTVLKAVEAGKDTAGMPAFALLAGSGTVVLLEYMMQPLTVALVYFTFEGMLRFVAAFITGEIVPTLPLALDAWIHGKMIDAAAERALGNRVPDLVEAVDSPDIKLRIRSCRPKDGWNHLMTIFYKDEMYEVAQEAEGDLPRRFTYWLRRKPDHKVVRGTYHYDPQEVLPNR